MIYKISDDVTLDLRWRFSKLTNTSSLTPPEQCEYTPPKKKKELDLPVSVSLMFDAIWMIGIKEFDFPEEAEPLFDQDSDGRYHMTFAFLNEAGSPDDKRGYVDPDYIDSVSEYLGRLSVIAPKDIKIDAYAGTISAGSKLGLYTLLCRAIEDEELFTLHQPEEMCRTTPAPLSAAEAPLYLNEKFHNNFTKACQEDPDEILSLAPMKPYASRDQYMSEACMAGESPFMVHMGQIRAYLLAEGERHVPVHYASKRDFLTVGFN